MNPLSSANSHFAHHSFSIATLFTIGLLAIFTGSATAATTFGSSLAHSPNNGSCGGPGGGTCGLAITDIAVDARADGGLSAPTDGVIVRWRLRGLPATSTSAIMSLRVYRQDTVAGVSADETPALSGDIEAFDTRIPVAAGDRLGISQTMTGSSMIVVTNLTYGSPGAGETDYWSSPPALGVTAAPNHSDLNRELLINADVEPDADSDGYGDETQDLCPSNPAIQIACPATAPSPADTVKPILSLLKLTGKKGFSFSSTEAGVYSVEVDRVLTGRLRGKNCSRAAKRGARCKIYRRYKRKSTTASAGSNTVSLSTKRFPPGRYCIRVSVTDAAGNVSEPVDREFTIRKKRRSTN